MAMFSVNAQRFDPYHGFNFRVMWDGRPVAGITKVSALSRSTEPIVFREGGMPNNFRISPGLTKFEPIVLERGLSHDKAFEDWANLVYNVQGQAAMSLAHYRKDLIIQLLNEQGAVALAYNVYRCWVSKYEALSELDASGCTVTIERLVLQHEGWERDQSVAEPSET